MPKRKLIDKAKRCESGCGCRYGTEDPDRLDCACDGNCCNAPYEIWFATENYCNGHPGKRPRTVAECVQDLRAHNVGEDVPCPFCGKLKDPSKKLS